MTDQQAGEYARFAESLTERGLPDPVRVFLLAMREHQLRADLAGAALARRAAALETAREGPLPAGRARVGHDKNGAFSARRLSDELAGRGRLPRAVLVAAVAEAYARRSGERPAVVGQRLEALRVTAEAASSSAKAAEQEQAMAGGRRFPTHSELRTARAERDEARERLDALQETLAALQGRFTELSVHDLERSKTIGVQQQRITELLEQAETLRAGLAEREQTLTAAQARNSELETTALRLRAQVDQLAAEVEELRGALAQRGAVRQDSGPDSPADRPDAPGADGSSWAGTRATESTPPRPSPWRLGARSSGPSSGPSSGSLASSRSASAPIDPARGSPGR